MRNLKFGFAISIPRSINMDVADNRLLKQLEEEVPSFKRCMNCGACSATCSARQFTDYNIRRIHSLFRMQQYQDLEKELRPCMLCGKCTLVCPRGVNLRSMIMNMKKILTDPKRKDNE